MANDDFRPEVVPDATAPVRWTRKPSRPKATVGMIIGVAALMVVIPACGSSSIPTTAQTSTSRPASTTSTSSSATFSQGSAAEVADCEADAKVLEVALDAAMAEKGTFPSPPAPWSAANYTANFSPLTSASDGGPFLHTPPSTTDYVIEYDAAGHIWIAPPGSYSATYNTGQDFDKNPNICLAAVH